MILIALALVCLLSVPLTGGHLGRLAHTWVRATWVPVLALAVQVGIVSVAAGGDPTLHRVLHIATYALIATFLWANRRLPGVPVILAGAVANAAAIIANAGVMPASATAERLAGLHLGTGFHNSAPVTHPMLLWLGDVIPWPGPLPNVLSVGDCLIYAGTLVLVHRVCRRPQPSVTLSPLAD